MGKSILQTLFRYSVPIHILFVGLVIAGVAAYFELGREELPYVVANRVRITATLPGASPEEMDLYVARPISAAVKDQKGVKKVTTTSEEGRLVSYVYFWDGAGDPDVLSREVSQTVDQIPDLPADLLGPYYARPPVPFPMMTLTIQGGTELARHDAWQGLQDALYNLKDVEMVEVIGDRERHIEVAVDPFRMNAMGLRLDAVTDNIRNALVNKSAGTVTKTLGNRRIRVEFNPESPQALGQIPLKDGLGSAVLSDIAKVNQALMPAKIAVKHNAEDAWLIQIHRRKGANASRLSHQVRKVMSDFNTRAEEKNQPFRLLMLQDYTQIVTAQLSSVTSSALFGVLLVMLILWLFLGFQNAFYASIGIPVAFFVAFFGMQVFDLTLNILSLFGFALICGIIVDDVIVVVENVARHKEAGKSPFDAVLAGLKEVTPSVLAATFTTIAAFMSLLLMQGGMRDFFSMIPKVTVLALLASLAECFLLLPLHLRHGSYGKKGKRRKKNRAPLLTKAMNFCRGIFLKICRKLLVRPLLSLAILLVFGMLSLWAATMRFDFVFFEKPMVRASSFFLEFPKDMDIESLDEILVDSGETLLKKYNEVGHYIAIAGRSDYDYVTRVLPNMGTLKIFLEPDAVNMNTGEQLIENIRSDLHAIPGVEKVNLTLASNQPPVGTPVKIQLYGHDPEKLRLAVDRVVGELASVDSIRNIVDPLKTGVRELKLEIDPAKVRQLGLTPADVGELLFNANTGRKAGKMDLKNEVVDIYVKLAGGQSDRIFEAITLPDGRAVALDQLGTMVEVETPEKVNRSQGKLFLAVTADVDEAVLSVYQTNQLVDKKMSTVLLPDGVTFSQEGQSADMRDSVASLVRAGFISMGLIYFILAVLFRSYFQPFFVLFVVPLAMLGVFWGMAIGGKALTVVGLIGLIGLMGIVVNDALVWMSFFNQSVQEEGLSAKDAALLAVERRFRPIWLTTITTVVGLLPIAFNPDAGFINTVAVTIVWGLTGATILLLLFLPVICVVGEGIQQKILKRLAPKPWAPSPVPNPN